jgi:hypothetical protein
MACSHERGGALTAHRINTWKFAGAAQPDTACNFPLNHIDCNKFWNRGCTQFDARALPRALDATRIPAEYL